MKLLRAERVTEEGRGGLTPRGSRGRHRRPRRRGAIVAVAALVLASGLAATDLAVYAGEVHTGVRVAGLSLAGMDVGEATRTLEGLSDELGSRRISFRHPSGLLSATPRALGWRPDPASTAAAAFDIGRTGPPWDNLAARALAWVRPLDVSWREDWDRVDLRKLADAWTREAGQAPREGRVWVEDGEIRTVDPAPGSRVDARVLAHRVAAVVDGRASSPVTLPLVETSPLTSDDDVRDAVERVEEILEDGVVARIGDTTVKLEPSELGGLIRSEVRRRRPDPAIAVRFVPKRVARLLEPYRDDFEVEARSASFSVSGGRVSIAPSVPGRALDAERAARALLRIARSRDRRGPIRLVEVEPELTTKEAKALGIVEQVSTFTTNHEPGEPRVVNIHKAADILDGALVLPGQTFSLNGHLGNRTAERGFVEAPVIYNGEFTTDIGGGVSQLATTMFNAAFFGAYPILEYQAHSYYISRYPKGREATVSWPKPDLVFRNDTSTALLIDTSYTGTSITVTIYGDRHGRTVRATRPVVTGRNEHGYRVTVRRIVERDGEVIRQDTFGAFYRYD